MKSSMIIKTLQRAIDKHGDLDVRKIIVSRSKDSLQERVYIKKVKTDYMGQNLPDMFNVRFLNL